MARLSLFLLVVAVAVFTPNIPQCEAGWLDRIIGTAVDSVAEFGTTNIVDQICNTRVMPTIKKFELYFRGRVWCPGWTTIQGESLTRSRTRVVNKAVEDFARKAVAAGLMTQEDANPLLNA
ncbi:anti-lipopolysaccharide factor-like [Eriocheir sinensis]|uniref:Anti-lipopolysaccharide factor n=1 Tax=Eriocheir sinensis TaxID=95602 RepID=A6XIA2_ERISI|nr:anti-lipopolysaccharide factor-like [Eriocheir sinensis]ABG82027.1 anti-lipopolysaccharide factor [Eriocheir sinensis]UWS06377.1 anti-lipopolysaccharide factor [Eriocheir hepuensis]